MLNAIKEACPELTGIIIKKARSFSDDEKDRLPIMLHRKDRVDIILHIEAISKEDKKAFLIFEESTGIL